MFRYLQHLGVSLAKLNQEGLQQFRVLLNQLANLLELRLISQEGKVIGTVSCSSSLGRTTSVGSSLGSGSEKVLWLGSSSGGGSGTGTGKGRGSSRAGRCSSASSASSSRRAGGGGGGGGRSACVSLEMIRDTLQ